MSAIYRPLICIISAPSGSGKSTLVNELLKLVPNLDFSISYTTRPSRGSEQNGKQYHFVSREEFEQMIRNDEFLEHANVFGNYYGTAKRFLREAEKKKHDLLLDIDVQGAEQMKRQSCRKPSASLCCLRTARLWSGVCASAVKTRKRSLRAGWSRPLVRSETITSTTIF